MKKIMGNFKMLSPFIAGNYTKNRKNSKKDKYLVKEKKPIIQYYGEFSFKENIFLTALPLCRLNFDYLNNIIVAYFFKWVKMGLIEVITEKEAGIFKEDEPVFNIDLLEKKVDKVEKVYSIKINLNREKESLKNKLEDFSDNIEKDLFAFMVEASSEDMILQKNELESWSSKNFSKLARFSERIMGESEVTLIKEGYYISKKSLNPFAKPKLIASDKGISLEENIINFRSYLVDFFTHNEGNSYNIQVLEDLMIRAALVGATDEMYNQFEKLYINYSVEGLFTPSVIKWGMDFAKKISITNAASSRNISFTEILAILGGG